MMSKLNTGSVIPKIELEITLGSRINRAPPINETIFGKNFLHKKYIGKTVSTEITIETILWRSTKVWNSPVFNILKNTAKNVGHPLLAKINLLGNSPLIAISYAYEKYTDASNENDMSYGK